MTKITDKDVMEALRGITPPGHSENVVSGGMVSGLQVKGDGHVLFALEVDPRQGPALEALRQEAARAVAALPGVTKVSAVLTAERKAAPASKPAGAAAQIENLVPHIKHVIAVASGKGSVGKSTVAANLAVALAAAGKSVGLLDADIYGPSVPMLLGLRGRKPEVVDEKMQPLEAFGLKVVSMGMLVEEESPMIWRGPMIQSALKQFLQDVDWGPLDILVIDMPPGTGDAQLTISQKANLSGAVIVSTPQDIALLDARKGLNMFRKVGVPVLGIIENMSVFCCPQCGHESPIFGRGGAKAEAHKMGCPFLGEIPLHPDIRQYSDDGRPVAAMDPQKPYVKVYHDIAARVLEQLAEQTPELKSAQAR